MKVVKIYAIYDRVSMWFPFFCFKAMNDGEAMRTFKQILSQPETAPAKDPFNYILQCVGTWDQVEGKLVGFDINKNVATGIDLIRPENEEQENGGEET
jgi:hypothetical protein